MQNLRKRTNKQLMKLWSDLIDLMKTERNTLTETQIDTIRNCLGTVEEIQLTRSKF